jgi:hypothetical protein
VDERLKRLGTGVRYLGSDRAKALIPPADQGLAGLSRPEFFQVTQESIQRYALAMGRHLRPAYQDLTKATETWARRPGGLHADTDVSEARTAGAARHAEGQRWEAVQHP